MNSLIKDQKKENRTEFEASISEDEFKNAEKTFVDTLSKYSLLYEIPFIYLVPDEKLLPKETLKFFELDPYWIQSLLDGACSIGRNTLYDYSHDEAMIQVAYRCAMEHNTQVRRELVPERIHKEEGRKTGSIYSGFLLHSQMVSDYNGLEVTGEDEKGNELSLVRLEHLSDMVMFGIFGGTLHKVKIAQPKESLHLGINSSCLRDIQTGQRRQDKKVEIKPDENRKIPIGEIAKNMQAVLAADKITSAELALELIQNAYTVVYTKNTKEVSPYEVSGTAR
ncbi:MAG: hypothetical protein HDR01_00615 [Lachnospiraceae bacterium]|nr:hypothetical protein [Lachnospiraceae bacterium]